MTATASVLDQKEFAWRGTTFGVRRGFELRPRVLRRLWLDEAVLVLEERLAIGLVEEGDRGLQRLERLAASDEVAWGMFAAEEGQRTEVDSPVRALVYQGWCGPATERA